MKSLLTRRQRLLLVLVAGLMSGALVWGARTLGWLQSAELWQYDVTTTALAAREPLDDVTLVGLTDKDFNKSGWPIPDAELARLIQAILSNGARTVGIDIYRESPVGDGNEQLMEVLRDPRVVIISRLPDETEAGVGAPKGVQLGFADVPIDTDGVARRALLLVNRAGDLNLSFPLQLALNFTNQKQLRASNENPRFLAFGGTVVPPIANDTGPYTDVDSAGYQVLTHYRNRQPIVRRVTADSVLEGQVEIAGQLVILAITSDTVKDYFSTPLNRRTGADFTYGAEIHAAIAQQLIDYSSNRLEPFRSLPTTSTALLIMLAAFGGAVCAVLWPARALGLVVGAVGAAVIALALSYMQRNSLLLPALPLSMAWGFGFLCAFSYIANLARRHRAIMAELFASQLSEDLSAEIWSQRSHLLEGRKPVSRKLFVTVLLADIEGSTRTGRNMEAADFMNWISTLLDQLSNVAQQHGGFVEKFTGDGILVVFGAPLPSTTPIEQRSAASAALACARHMQEAARLLNQSGSGPDYGLRIGLNSGEVVAGTLGVPGAMRYNIIGDTVNVAARVEALSKTFDRDQTGLRPIAMAGVTAALLPQEASIPAPNDLLHDDGKTVVSIHLAR
ncbi:MAG: CHASE2 domain-containing protein [Roseobacter sp.]